MNRPRITPVLILVLLALLLTGAAGCQKAGTDAGLPDDLLALLPADPVVIFSLSSLDDWEGRRQALADSTNGAPLLEGGALAEIDLAAILAEKHPAVAAAVAGDRPLALAVGLPAPMTNQLDLVLVIPVTDPATVGDLADGDEFHTQLAMGDYVALATSPAYTPADTVPAIARDRLPGLVSLAVDLESVVTMYRPFVQMGLATMAAMPPEDDESGARPGMDPEMAEALGEMLDILMDSVRRKDLAVDLDDRELNVAWRLDLIPGCPLEPGPQPDFARALALTGALPEDAPVQMAMAVDQTRQMDVFGDYYLATMDKEMEQLPKDLARGIAAWFAGYLDTYDYVNVPMAVAGGYGPGGIEMHMVVDATDPAGLLAHMERQLTILGDLGLGLTVTPVDGIELGGVGIHGWDLAWDDALMDMVMAEAEAADVAPTGGQLKQTFAMLRELAPGLRVARVGDLVLLTTTTDHAELGLRVADLLDPRGPDPRLAALAKAAGPHTVEAYRGDVAMIMATVFEVMYDFDPALTADLRARPLDVAGVATYGESRVGFTGSMDVAGLRATVETVKHMITKMEAKQDEEP